MRDSISLLDQLLSYGDEILTLARVENVLGLVNQATIGKLVDYMAAGDAGAGVWRCSTRWWPKASSWGSWPTR